MATFLANDFLTMVRMDLNRDLIAHGSRGNKDCGLAKKYFRSTPLELIYGGIFAINIVTHLGFRHGATHFRSGTGDGITSEIDCLRRG